MKAPHVCGGGEQACAYRQCACPGPSATPSPGHTTAPEIGDGRRRVGLQVTLVLGVQMGHRRPGRVSHAALPLTPAEFYRAQQVCLEWFLAGFTGGSCLVYPVYCETGVGIRV